MGFGDNTVTEIKTTPPTESEGRGLVFLLWGITSVGKTYTALSFPEPIVVIDTESRAKDTVDFYYPDKKINIHETTELKEEIDKSMDDLYDEIVSINNTTEKLSEYIRDVKSGKIKGGTLVIDSATEIWEQIQGWMFDKLSKMTTGTGKAKASDEMRTVIDQRDWKIANVKHNGIVKVLTTLKKYNINIVFTAKEKAVPEYVKDKPVGMDRIRVNKDLIYPCHVIVHLVRENDRYMGYIEKLGVKRPPKEPIEEITYDKIMELKPMG